MYLLMWNTIRKSREIKFLFNNIKSVFVWSFYSDSDFLYIYSIMECWNLIHHNILNVYSVRMYHHIQLLFFLWHQWIYLFLCLMRASVGHFCVPHSSLKCPDWRLTPSIRSASCFAKLVPRGLKMEFSRAMPCHLDRVDLGAGLSARSAECKNTT